MLELQLLRQKGVILCLKEGLQINYSGEKFHVIIDHWFLLQLVRTKNFFEVIFVDHVYSQQQHLMR